MIDLNAWLARLPLNDLVGARSETPLPSTLSPWGKSRPHDQCGHTLWQLNKGLNDPNRNPARISASTRRRAQHGASPCNDMEAIYRGLGSVYMRFVERYTNTREPESDSPVDGAGDGARVVLLGAHAKWSYFRRQPVIAALWREVHAAYQFAELDRLDAHSVVLSSRPYEIHELCRAVRARGDARHLEYRQLQRQTNRDC